MLDYDPYLIHTYANSIFISIKTNNIISFSLTPLFDFSIDYKLRGDITGVGKIITGNLQHRKITSNPRGLHP